jgi:hypothetical protein
MSISEMKELAIEKIANIDNETELKELLVLLDNLIEQQNSKVFNVSKFFESVSERYDDVLKKLAE